MPIFHRSYVAKRKRWLRAKAKPGQESIHIMISDHCQYRNMVMTCKYVQVCEGRNSKCTRNLSTNEQQDFILGICFICEKQFVFPYPQQLCDFYYCNQSVPQNEPTNGSYMFCISSLKIVVINLRKLLIILVKTYFVTFNWQ